MNPLTKWKRHSEAVFVIIYEEAMHTTSKLYGALICIMPLFTLPYNHQMGLFPPITLPCHILSLCKHFLHIVFL